MSSDGPTKPKPGLSLYANLLEPGSKEQSANTITGAPVIYKLASNGDEAPADEAAAKKQQINAAALRFQPTKRPQVASSKKSTPAKFANVTAHQPPSAVPIAQSTSQLQKTSIADWAAEGDEDEYYYGGAQRPRGGRKRRKKNKDQQRVAQDWDDIYDPSRPNNYEEYKNSDEMFRELREWKDRLYAHRVTRKRSDSTDSEAQTSRRPAMQFAPPPSETAPPPSLEPAESQPLLVGVGTESPETGGDAFTRRMRMSQTSPTVFAPTSGPASRSSLPAQDSSSYPSKREQSTNSTISRAPVRYNLPHAPEEIPKSEVELEVALEQELQVKDDAPTSEDTPRSLRPGQKGFAERLMTKYGWTKGHGLGANSTGIITPLQAKLEKQKKRPDAEGGGYAGPSGLGKITGGKRRGGGEGEGGRFGRMSEVVVLRGMVNGMDLQFELGQGNLLQEIGEECGEKYGRVERVFIDQTALDNAPVFIKFTSQLSALRAVNALEGRVFNGNAIEARFFDSEKFDLGQYE